MPTKEEILEARVERLEVLLDQVMTAADDEFEGGPGWSVSKGELEDELESKGARFTTYAHLQCRIDAAAERERNNPGGL